MLFLKNRTHATDTATLLSTGSGGWIRAWCMFGGGLAGEFMASNNHRELILCMTSDENNELLMTGDTQGYIKIWNIKNYCIRGNHEGTQAEDKNRSVGEKSGLKNRRHINFSENKAKRSINTKAPPLVFCLRAHLQPIISIDYVPKYRLMITASTDCSLRLWRVNGQYVGTFGQRTFWNLPAEGDGEVPFDLQRVASSNLSRKRWSIAKNFMQVAGRLTLGLTTVGQSAGYERESSATKSAVLREGECRIDMNNILGE